MSAPTRDTPTSKSHNPPTPSLNCMRMRGGRRVEGGRSTSNRNATHHQHIHWSSQYIKKHQSSMYTYIRMGVPIMYINRWSLFLPKGRRKALDLWEYKLCRLFISSFLTTQNMHPTAAAAWTSTATHCILSFSDSHSIWLCSRLSIVLILRACCERLKGHELMWSKKAKWLASTDSG